MATVHESIHYSPSVGSTIIENAAMQQQRRRLIQDFNELLKRTTFVKGNQGAASRREIGLEITYSFSMDPATRKRNYNAKNWLLEFFIKAGSGIPRKALSQIDVTCHDESGKEVFTVTTNDEGKAMFLDTALPDREYTLTLS